MKPMHQVAAAGAVCLLLVAALWAATYRFDPDGPTGDWSDNGAWDLGSPPGPTDDAIIEKDKTVTVDAADREVLELWLKDNADVDLEYDVCATDRLFVYRDSTVSGEVTINGPGEAGAREDLRRDGPRGGARRPDRGGKRGRPHAGRVLS